jgi:hypothetical protein
MEPTQRVAWPCVVVATFRFPERFPARARDMGSRGSGQPC